MKTIKGAAAALGALLVLTACGGGDDGDAGGDASAGAEETSAGASADASADAGEDDGGAFADGSAADIVAAAKEDMAALESVRLRGDINTEGQKLTLDLSLTTAGDCTGSVTVDGGRAEIVSLDGQSWFKPDAAFWEANAGEEAELLQKAVGDNWVLLPSGDETFASFCDLDGLLEDLTEEGPGGSYRKGGVKDIDGQQAVKITKPEDQGTVNGYIATEGEHYFLRLEMEGGDEPGSATFSDFDAELDITAPPEDEVVDLSKLGGGAG